MTEPKVNHLYVIHHLGWNTDVSPRLTVANLTGKVVAPNPKLTVSCDGSGIRTAQADGGNVIHHLYRLDLLVAKLLAYVVVPVSPPQPQGAIIGNGSGESSPQAYLRHAMPVERVAGLHRIGRLPRLHGSIRTARVRGLIRLARLPRHIGLVAKASP